MSSCLGGVKGIPRFFFWREKNKKTQSLRRRGESRVWWSSLSLSLEGKEREGTAVVAEPECVSLLFTKRRETHTSPHYLTLYSDWIGERKDREKTGKKEKNQMTELIIWSYRSSEIKYQRSSNASRMPQLYLFVHNICSHFSFVFIKVFCRELLFCYSD